MTGTGHAGRYGALLRRPHVGRTFALVLLGRLGYAVLPLSLLFTVRQSTGSFASGATVIAVFGATTLVMPLQSRLTDRHGQRRILPIVGSVFVAALLLGALLAGRPAGAGTWSGLAVALGLSAPALGPGMRAQWRAVVPDGAERTTAYALDGVGEEAMYLIGPALAGALLAWGPARHALLLVAALIAVGVVGLVTSPAAPAAAVRPAPTTTATRLRSPVRSARLRLLLLVMATFGIVTGLMYTGLAARADASGHAERAGYVGAGIAVASMIGGLLWGLRAHRRAWTIQLAGAMTVVGAAVGAAAAATTWPTLALCLAGAGLAMAPTYTVAFTAADRETPPALRTEASTWVSTVTNVGTSLGAAAAGWAAGHHGPTAPFWAAGTLGLAVAVVLLADGGAGRSGQAGKGRRP